MKNKIELFLTNITNYLNVLADATTFGLNLTNIINADFLFLIFQILLLYSLVQIFHECNVLRLVLNILVFLVILSGLLMIFQFELFACFLIVSEVLLFAFIYAYLYNLNLTNKYYSYESYNTSLYYLILYSILIGLIFVNLNWNVIIFNLTDLFVVSQKSIQIYTNIVFSDLIFLFNFFFIYNSMLYVLLIIILFIMTFIIIYTTFLMYLLNINVYLYHLHNKMEIFEAPTFNGTYLLKKKQKMKKLRIFKVN